MVEDCVASRDADDRSVGRVHAVLDVSSQLSMLGEVWVALGVANALDVVPGVDRMDAF